MKTRSTPSIRPVRTGGARCHSILRMSGHGSYWPGCFAKRGVTGRRRRTTSASNASCAAPASDGGSEHEYGFLHRFQPILSRGRSECGRTSFRFACKYASAARVPAWSACTLPSQTTFGWCQTHAGRRNSGTQKRREKCASGSVPEPRSANRCFPTEAAPWASFLGCSESRTTTSSSVKGASPIARRSFSYSSPADALWTGESQSPSRWHRGTKRPHNALTFRCAYWVGLFGMFRNRPRSKRKAGAAWSAPLRGRRRKRSIDCPASASRGSNRLGRCSAARRPSAWPERNSLPYRAGK